jgi:hypothetical protein
LTATRDGTAVDADNYGSLKKVVKLQEKLTTGHGGGAGGGVAAGFLLLGPKLASSDQTERALRMADVEHMKQPACQRAAQEVQDGMVFGPVQPCTIFCVARAYGARRHTPDGCPDLRRTTEIATQLAIPLTTDDQSPSDLAVDGADEVDAHLNLSKALGVHCCAKNHGRQCRPVCRCGGCRQ